MLSELRTHTVAESRLPQVDPDNVGFGRYISDHMFTMSYENGQWQAPEIVPYGPLPMEPGVAMLHYGQSVFEGMKAFRGEDGRVRLFRPDMNYKRLKTSCVRLCIPVPTEEHFLGGIEALLRVDAAWVPARPGHSLYIRPIIFATEQHLEVRPSRTYRFVIYTAPVKNYFDTATEGVSLKVQEKFTRAAPGGTGYAKTAANYAAALYPGEQAQQEGYTAALWLDGLEHRYVEEVGQMNIFFRLGDTVVTPALKGTILPGVTRDSVITLLKDWGIPVEERQISIDEVMDGIRSGALSEAFGAGTAAVVSPVGRIANGKESLDIGDRTIGELTRRLYDAITGIQSGRIADPHGWVRVVETTRAATV